MGKQIGTVPGRSSNMTWTASLAGGVRINWEAAGAASRVPPALQSMSLDVAFNARVDVTAGKLLYLSLDVKAGLAIGIAGDGSPVFDLAIVVGITVIPANVKPIVAAATGSISFGPVQVKSFDAMLTLFPDPVAPGQPKAVMTAKLKDMFIGDVDMGTMILAGSAFTKVVTTGGVDATKWYVIGTLVAEVRFDVAAAALGVVPSMTPTPDGRAAALGSKGSVSTTVTFNSDTRDISATVSADFETDYFTVVASGSFNSVCTDDGMFMSGTLTFTAETPLPLPSIAITATKHCQPWMKEVLTIRAEIDSAAWRDANSKATAAAALGAPQTTGMKQPNYASEKAHGKSPLAALGMATSLSFDVDNLVISLTGSYLDVASRGMDDLSWIFKVDGTVSLKDTSGSPVPTGVLSVDVAMLWAFAPRGDAMQAKLGKPLAELNGTCAAAAGASCAGGEVCGAGLACVKGECVDVGAIADADDRASAAEAALAAQSYGAGLACAIAGDATGESPRVELDGNFEIANDDWLTIAGSFHAVVPCGEDDYASAEVRMSLDRYGVKIGDLAIGMELSCAAAAADVKKFRVFGSLDNIEIGSFSMGGVYLDLTAYHTSAEVTKAGQYWVGTISAEFSVTEGLDVALTASFSTKPDEGGLTLGIQAGYTKTFSRGTELELSGEGTLKLPCAELGDFYIAGTATVTGVKLGGNELVIDGAVTFSSNCGRLFQLTVEISVDSMDRRGIEVLPDVWVQIPKLDLRAQSLAKGELDIGLCFALGKTGELFVNYSLPSGAVTVGVNFHDDTICQYMKDLVSAIPGVAIDPCKEMRNTPLSFVAKALDSIPVRFMTIRFTYDAGMHLIVWLDGMMIGSLNFSVGMIISKIGGQFRFFWLLKFDVPEVIKLPKIFGPARGVMEDVINTGLSMLSVVKSIGFVYTTHKVMTFPKAAAELLPGGLEDMDAGLTLALSLNIVAGNDDTSENMNSVSESQTKDAAGGGDLKAKMQKDFNKKSMENFVMQLPISMTEFCLSHSFLMWNSMTQPVGIDIFPPDHRYLAFKPGVCISFAPASVSVRIEVTEERDMYEGGFIARMYEMSNKNTVMRQTMFEVAITTVGIEIAAISSASLVHTEDTWLINPWGLLPKVAVLFPQT